MKFVKAGVLALAAALSMGAAIAQEPVDPQPAQPLTYTNPAYQKVTLSSLTFANPTNSRKAMFRAPSMCRFLPSSPA